MNISHNNTRLYLYKKDAVHESSVKFNNFLDGDTHCLIDKPELIKGSEVLIFHQLYPNQNEWIFRLLLLLNTLQAHDAKRIKVFTPYFPYARQDRAHLPGESVSSDILCRLIKMSGCDELYTIDCHFMKGAPECTREGLMIQNLLVQDLLMDKLKERVEGKYEIIGPDEGSLYLTTGKTMLKSRNAHYSDTSGQPIHRDLASMKDDHLTLESTESNQTVVIADDMIASGSTIIKALDLLKNRGVKSLYVVTTHGFFLNNSYSKITELSSGIIFSDTIPRANSTPVVENIFEHVKQTAFRNHV